MQTPPPCCGGVGEQRINYIILFDIFVLLSQRFVLRIAAIAIRCSLSLWTPISVDTVINQLLVELIFLIYTFTFRKKLISVLIWFHSSNILNQLFLSYILFLSKAHGRRFTTDSRIFSSPSYCYCN